MKPSLDTMKRILGAVLLAGCVASPAIQPLAAHAAPQQISLRTGGSTIMYERYRVMPGGASVPVSGSTISSLAPGHRDTLMAPDSIPGTAPSTAYAFLFWDIAGHLYLRPRATFVAPSAPVFAATAWYEFTGPGGPGPTAVTAYGFSLPKDAFLPSSPIASVTPSSAWAAPSNSVSTTTAVTITAVDPLEFVQWLAPDATATGAQLAAGAGVSTLAIAFYGPNPCQAIENELSGLSVADFPPPDPAKEMEVLVHALTLQLQACEAQHGGAQSIG
jgi:hypothetical protein